MQQCPQQRQQSTKLQTFVLVGGPGAEPGSTIFDLTQSFPSSQPASPHVSICTSSTPVVGPVSTHLSPMTTPPTCPYNAISSSPIGSTRSSTVVMDRGRSRLCSTDRSPVKEATLLHSAETLLSSIGSNYRASHRRSVSAENNFEHFRAREGRSRSRRNHQMNVLGLDSAMEFMFNNDTANQDAAVVSTRAFRQLQEDDSSDGAECVSADISVSSLLATDLEMLESLKDEHRQGGNGARTRMKEREKKEREKKEREKKELENKEREKKELQRREQQQNQSRDQLRQSLEQRQKDSIYKASLEYLMAYYGDGRTEHGGNSTKHLNERASEKTKHNSDRSTIERPLPDSSTKPVFANPRSRSRSRLLSAPLNIDTPLTKMQEDGTVLLVSNQPTPTQFYNTPKTRKALRKLTMDVETDFDEMLVYGFLWNPVPECLDPHLRHDGYEYWQEDDVDDQGEHDFALATTPPQYFTTLRITLTPWHARADESEIYGHLGNNKALPMPTASRRASVSLHSLSSKSSLCAEASTTTISITSSDSRESEGQDLSSLPMRPYLDATQEPCLTENDMVIKSAPLILVRSSSLLKPKNSTTFKLSPHANDITSEPQSSSAYSTPCHPFDATPIHPFHRPDTVVTPASTLPVMAGPSINSLSTVVTTTGQVCQDRHLQTCPPRKGSLSPLSFPIINCHDSSSADSNNNGIGGISSNNSDGDKIYTQAPPEKNKNRPQNPTRVFTLHDSNPSALLPPRKGSTPAIFYSPGGRDENHLSLSEDRKLTVRPKSISTGPRRVEVEGNVAPPSLRAAARQPQGAAGYRKRSDQSDAMSASLAAARRRHAEAEALPIDLGLMTDSFRRQALPYRQKHPGRPNRSSPVPEPPKQQRQQQQQQQQQSVDETDQVCVGRMRSLSHDSQVASYPTSIGKPAVPLKTRRQPLHDKANVLPNCRIDYKDGLETRSPALSKNRMRVAHHPCPPTENAVVSTVAAAPSSSSTAHMKDTMQEYKSDYYHTTKLDMNQRKAGRLRSASASDDSTFDKSELRMAHVIKVHGNNALASPTSLSTPPFTVSGVSIAPRSVQRRLLQLQLHPQ
ncbi:hypothetical protein BGZ94_000259 [Podila epigama]|nr:hypothetical protein BGZ94_000259 [Podila epigama]